MNSSRWVRASPSFCAIARKALVSLSGSSVLIAASVPRRPEQVTLVLLHRRPGVDPRLPSLKVAQPLTRLVDLGLQIAQGRAAACLKVQLLVEPLFSHLHSPILVSLAGD